MTRVAAQLFHALPEGLQAAFEALAAQEKQLLHKYKARVGQLRRKGEPLGLEVFKAAARDRACRACFLGLEEVRTPHPAKLPTCLAAYLRLPGAGRDGVAGLGLCGGEACSQRCMPSFAPAKRCLKPGCQALLGRLVFGLTVPLWPIALLL